jgi:hypothetical protein
LEIFIIIVIHLQPEHGWQELSTPIKTQSPSHALNETFDQNNASPAERSSVPVEPVMNAPTTPLLNAFAASFTRTSSIESKSTPVISFELNHDEHRVTPTTQLSPIQTDALPSDSAVVDLYTQISTKSKPMYSSEPTPKPVRQIILYNCHCFQVKRCKNISYSNL